MDFTTSYLGLTLKNPIIPSSSPLSRKLSNLRHMEDAGAAAIVLHSLFEEEITGTSQALNNYLVQGTESFAEALSYFPEAAEYQSDLATYVEHIGRAKAALDIPIIASLNGVSSGGWVHYARHMEEAGADALELNVYYLPTDPELSGERIEQVYIDVLKNVRAAVNIPVAMKLSPYFSSIGNFAQRLVEAGADGLVLFNRFYQPDLDPENLAVVPNLQLSNAHEMRLPLRWVAILYGHIKADLALTTGVHTSGNIFKAVAVGASATMVASELLRNGIERLRILLLGLEAWLKEHEYDSVAQLQGCLSQINCAEPAAFERANYLRVLNSFAPDYPQRMGAPDLFQ